MNQNEWISVGIDSESVDWRHCGRSAEWYAQGVVKCTVCEELLYGAGN